MLHSIFANFYVGSSMGSGAFYYCFNIAQLTWILLLVQCAQFISKDQMFVYKSNVIFRAVFYIICFYAIMLYGAGSGKDFLYSQF